VRCYAILSATLLAAPLLLLSGARPGAALGAQTSTAAGPATASSGAIGPAAEEALRPGDVVRIAVWRKPEFSGDFPVADDGSITHPLYRAVSVAGLAPSTARERLRAFLRQFDAEPQFVMEPLVRVTVRGEVEKPNVYTLTPATTIAQVLAVAGGPAERGRRDRVQLVRGDAVSRIDLTASGGAARSPIRSGDEIVVERQRSLFREYILPTMTLAGSIAAIASVIMRAQNR
jgi:polysaccharide export outer membrane protein